MGIGEGMYYKTVPIEPQNCLQTADSLVSGDRQQDYGHPIEDFRKTAKIWSAILGIDVTPEQVALCMVGVKISREVNKHKADNIVDGCGYFRTLEMIHEYYENKGVAECPSSSTSVRTNIGQ